MAASMAQIVDRITKEYDVDRKAAQMDAVCFVNSLLEKGLIHELQARA